MPSNSSEYAKKHYEDNKKLYVQRALEAKKRTVERNYAFLAELKKKPCMDCGGIFPPECMDFDHLSNKVASISHLVRKSSIKRLQSEIDKCDLVCSNCHRIRTKKRINNMPL